MQNAKKGDFARHKMKGKRAIELGSGMGLGGFALALLGCQTVVTDTKEVLSLLQRNYENNLTPAVLQGTDCQTLLANDSWTQAETLPLRLSIGLCRSRFPSDSGPRPRCASFVNNLLYLLCCHSAHEAGMPA